MARRERKTPEQAWLETWNPLRGMSIREAQAIFDASRQGDTQRLHWLFQEVEATNPVLLVCVERRASAIANFQWKVAEIAARDGALSNEQKDAAERFFSGIDNLTDALEHLDLAFFRGFSHVQPVWEADGTVREIALLDSWKFLRRGFEWLYNPRCTGFSEGDLQSTENARLVTVTRRRPIDYPALGLHIRHAVGSRDWGRFLERYALPKPAVVMHPGATNDQKADYLEGAQAVEQGQVSVWPNGASLTDFAGGARGTDPFSAFIEHQEKQIVLLATGGTLMSLAESGTGTLAGNAQSDVWHSIVARDSAVIAQAVNRALLRPYLERTFPGQPAAVQFGFDFSVPPTPKEVFEVAALAKQAGYVIDVTELEEQTGYTLKVEEQPQGTPMLTGSEPRLALPFANKDFQVHAGQTMAAGLRSQGQDHGEAASNVLAAFAKDTGPAADAIRKLLDDPSPEAAAALLKDLPNLIPDDPALAAVIADAMAEEFGKTVANKGADRVPAGNGNGGQFTGATNQPRGKEPETKPKHDRYGSTDTDKLSSDPKKNTERGMAAVEEVMRKKSGFVDKAMYRPEVGWIRFDYGWEGDPNPLKEDDGKGHKKGDTYLGGHGLSHIAAKHNKDLKHLPEVIANGEAFRHPHDPTKTYFVYGERFACVASLHKGAKRTITEFEESSKKIAVMKNYPRAQAPGK